MVIGGYNSDHTAIGKVEIIDLSGKNLSCPTIPDFPIDYASVGTFISNKALVCGGRSDGNSTAYDSCYSYTPGVKHILNLAQGI